MSAPTYHGWTHRPRSKGGTDPLDWDSITAGPWITPTLLNGWEDVGAPFCAFAYRHLFDGSESGFALEFRGHIEGGFFGTVAFQLPEEDRLGCDSVEGVLVDNTTSFAWARVYFDMSTGDVTIYDDVGGGGGGGAVAAADVSVADAGGYFTGTDVETALQELGAASQLLPWRVEINVVSQPSGSAGSWSMFNHGEALIWGASAYLSTGTQNAYLEWPVVLAAGTWTVEFFHIKFTDRGIYTLKLDGSSIGTIDGYAASATYNVRGQVTGVTVAASAKYTFRIEMATKNASSSSYVADIIQSVPIAFLRTA